MEAFVANFYCSFSFYLGIKWPSQICTEVEQHYTFSERELEKKAKSEMILKSLALLILDISSHYSNHPNLPTLSYLGHQFNSIIAIITTINCQLSTITIITNSIITGGTRHNAQGRFRCNLQVNRLMIKRKVIRGALLYI